MDNTTLSTLQTILQLGWPAIVLIMVFFIWRQYVNEVNQHMEDLREIAGLKNRLGPNYNPQAIGAFKPGNGNSGLPPSSTPK